ncbi:hypothetical protein BGZ83_009816 [Gryganskiella cystojenkinii]|nr:hypothetical protein BGZ83_009816 [Gryganskiella cystojenkinii]
MVSSAIPPKRPTRAAAAAASAASKKQSTPATKTKTVNVLSPTKNKKAKVSSNAAPRKGKKVGGRTSKEEEDKDEDDDDNQESDDADDHKDDDFKDDEEEESEAEEDSPEESEDDAFTDASYGQSRKRSASAAQSAKSTVKRQALASPKSKTKTSSTSTSGKSKTSSSSSTSASNSKRTVVPIPTQVFPVSSLKIPHPKGCPFPDAIQPETLEFIRDLKLNNDREYMMLNQERCDTAKNDFMDFIRMLKEGLREADPNIMNQEPKDAMMRIYRDVRFSNDKSPYKSQLACFFSRGGKKSIAAGYYFGISSGGDTFAGCGVWDPSGPVLHRIRQGLVDNQERFEQILSTDAIKKVTGGKTGIDALRPGQSQLKTGPVGFPKDHPMIEFLKRKCFAIGRSFTDEQVVSEGFLEEVLQTFDACVDLVHILNEWIG